MYSPRSKMDARFVLEVKIEVYQKIFPQGLLVETTENSWSKLQ